MMRCPFCDAVLVTWGLAECDECDMPLDGIGEGPVPMGEALAFTTGETMACCDLDDAEAAEVLGL